MLLIPRGCVLGHLVLGGIHWHELRLLQSHQGSLGQGHAPVRQRGTAWSTRKRTARDRQVRGQVPAPECPCTWPWACPPFPLSLSSPMEWDQSHLLRLMWTFRRWYLESGRELSSMHGRRQGYKHSVSVSVLSAAPISSEPIYTHTASPPPPGTEKILSFFFF